MGQVSRRTVLKGVAVSGAAAVLLPSQALAAPRSSVAAHGAVPAAAWLRTAYAVVKAQSVTPPTAARAYAVHCLAGYEALLPGMPRHRSLAGQLAGLPAMPRPRTGEPLDWPLVLMAASATACRGLFPQVSEAGKAAVDELAAADLAARRAAGVSARREKVSREHGTAVARAVLAWFATDGHAQALALPYAPPVGEAFWVPTPPNFGTAIEPHCHTVRPMVLRTVDEVAPVPPVAFSTDPSSSFYAQAQAVVDQAVDNTDETRDLARFWTDNPGFSGLPAGHWLSIAAQVSEQRELGLDLTVEALARTSVALHDAFLNCWTWKYRYNLLRPVTYIRRYLGASTTGWNTWVNTPQFPEYTSGHSVASRAAAVVLTDLLGPLSFTDTALASTVGIGQRTRSYVDFSAAAAAAARSRIYGGIHYPMGISAGMVQGDQVGALVVARLQTRRVR